MDSPLQYLNPIFEGDRVKLFAAIRAVQKDLGSGALAKDAFNPFHKSKYATLAATMELVLPLLVKHELCLLQLPISEDGKTVGVTTIIGHSSGASLSSTLRMIPVKVDPQGIGSAITYARRYTLQAILGITPDDDDGNEASNLDANKRDRVERQRPAQPKQPANTGGTETDPGFLEVRIRTSKTIDDLEEVSGQISLLTNEQCHPDTRKQLRKAYVETKRRLAGDDSYSK